MVSDAVAPGLLLAAPPLGDPNFSQAVVLLAAHGEDGSLGWVINGMPIAPVQQLLRDVGLTLENAKLPDVRSYDNDVRIGGPVSPRSAWLFYERDHQWNHEGEMILSERWAATGERALVEAVAQGTGPRNFRMVLGYAGWGPGQLEQEIRGGAWMPAPVDDDLMFEGECEGLWQRAYAELLGMSPLAFVGMRPGSA